MSTIVITTEDVLKLLCRWGKSTAAQPVIVYDGQTLTVVPDTTARQEHWTVLENDPWAWAGLVEYCGEPSDLAVPGATDTLRDQFGHEIAEARDRWQAIAEGRWDPDAY